MNAYIEGGSKIGLGFSYRKEKGKQHGTVMQIIVICDICT